MNFLSNEWPVVATAVLLAFVNLSTVDLAKIWLTVPKWAVTSNQLRV